MSKSTSFVDPNSLSIPDSSEPGPSRKRPRSELTADERKEARAHRNRIAAQNSRDRRKAQFSYLERRVAELEEENRQLRAGLGLNKERENEELRERIKTLEQGWDAVVKALAAQGLSTGLLPASKPAATEKPVPQSPEQTQQQQLATFPLSPAPSHTSLDNRVYSHSPPSTGGDHRNALFDVPAAGDLELFVAYPPETAISLDQSPPIDDSTMEDLFREIFVAPSSPTSSTLSLDADNLSATPSAAASASASEVSSDEMLDEIKIDDEKVNLDIQRLLELLPPVAPTEESIWALPTATIGVF